MKFKICHDPERKALSIPRAALQISGLDGQDELHLHADDGCVLLLPERPTAGETVKTIQMLVDINTQLSLTWRQPAAALWRRRSASA